MRCRTRTLAFLALSLWLVSGVALAERLGRLIGKVLDPEGNPLQGVAVTVSSPQIPSFKEVRTTDRKGIFTVDFRQIDVTYQYRFDKVGFQSVEAQQEWGLEGTQRYEWTMYPGSAPTVGGATPASTSAPAVEAFNAGVAAFKAKDHATAEAKFKEAVGHDPGLRQGWAALSTVQVELGHNQEAAEAAEKAIALGARDEAVLLARWQAYRNLKDEAKAAEALKDLESIGRRAEEAKRFHNEAVALVKAGDHAGAFAKFQEALAIDPDLQVSLLGLATAGLKIGSYSEAATAAEAVLKAEPNNEKAVRVRYNAYLGLGDKTKLIDALVGLAAYEPATARNGLLKLAFEAYDANDAAVAKERFGKVLQVDPNQPQAHYYLGTMFAAEGATEDAVRYLQRFLEIAPNDPEAAAARDMLKYLRKP